MIVIAFKVESDKLLVRTNPLSDWREYQDAKNEIYTSTTSSEVVLFASKEARQYMLNKIKNTTYPPDEVDLNDYHLEDIVEYFDVSYQPSAPALLLDQDSLNKFKSLLEHDLTYGGEKVSLAVINWIRKGMPDIHSDKSLVFRHRRKSVDIDVDSVIQNLFSGNQEPLKKNDFSYCKFFAGIACNFLDSAAWNLYASNGTTSELDNELVAAFVKRYLKNDWIDINVTPKYQDNE